MYVYYGIRHRFRKNRGRERYTGIKPLLRLKCFRLFSQHFSADCVPAADTPLTNASIPLHCSPLKLYFPAFVGLQIPGQETASITRYEHLDSVLVSNITSADSSRRECQFVCLYGTWTGPLCRRMDMLHKSDTNYQPVWQSCYFDPANYVNVSIFYNGFNISESTGNYDTSDWIPKLTVFPHGSRLLLRCEEVGEYIFSGPPVLLCSNGQWDAVPVRAGSNPEKPQSLQPKCEPLSDSVESKENENLIYPPLLTYTAYKGTVAPYYDGRLFVYPGSDLHLGKLRGVRSESGAITSIRRCKNYTASLSV